MHGRFVFSGYQDYAPVLNDVIVQVFPLLRSCRSLSSLGIEFDRFYGYNHLPILLSEDLFLETLIVTLDVKSHPGFARCSAQYLSQNSVLKSFTVALNYAGFSCNDSPLMETILRPFTATLQTESNVVVEKFIVRINMRFVCGPCLEVMAKLVRCNRTLKKLEVRLFDNNQDLSIRSTADALGVKRTLTVFGWPSSDVAGLIKFAEPFARNHSGQEAAPSISLSPVNVLISSHSQGLHYMNELARILGSNTTLKHVKFSTMFASGFTYWDDSRVRRNAEFVASRVGAELKLMLCNELRLNTSLESLVFGKYWKLLRVGSEWKLSYEGPCLVSKEPTSEYVVKVKMRQ